MFRTVTIGGGEKIQELNSYEDAKAQSVLSDFVTLWPIFVKWGFRKLSPLEEEIGKAIVNGPLKFIGT